MTSDVAGPPDDAPDGDSLRAPPYSWSDRFIRGAIRLARVRVAELVEVGPESPEWRRSYDAATRLLGALVDEWESRVALAQAVEDALVGEWSKYRELLREVDDDAPPA